MLEFSETLPKTISEIKISKISKTKKRSPLKKPESFWEVLLGVVFRFVKFINITVPNVLTPYKKN